jgi:Cu/Ag efflux protein CusF
MKHSLSWRAAVAALWAASAIGGAAAPAAAEPVATRATVQSRFEEDGGARLYVLLRLQLLVHAPFTTLTYRVPDRAVWERLQRRDQVEFSAARVAGENTVTAIRTLPP